MTRGSVGSPRTRERDLQIRRGQDGRLTAVPPFPDEIDVSSVLWNMEFDCLRALVFEAENGEPIVYDLVEPVEHDPDRDTLTFRRRVSA